MRLPKADRCGGSQEYIKRIGNAVMLIPYGDPRQLMKDSLDKFTDDFMLERNQPTEVEVRESFDDQDVFARHQHLRLPHQPASGEGLPAPRAAPELRHRRLEPHRRRTPLQGRQKLAPRTNHSALDEFLAPLSVYALDAEAAAAYGGIRADLERRGLPIGPLDTLIAAHALSLGATLVTNDTREFRRVPELRVENSADA